MHVNINFKLPVVTVSDFDSVVQMNELKFVDLESAEQRTIFHFDNKFKRWYCISNTQIEIRGTHHLLL